MEFEIVKSGYRRDKVQAAIKERDEKINVLVGAMKELSDKLAAVESAKSKMGITLADAERNAKELKKQSNLAFEQELAKLKLFRDKWRSYAAKTVSGLAPEQLEKRNEATVKLQVIFDEFEQYIKPKLIIEEEEKPKSGANSTMPWRSFAGSTAAPTQQSASAQQTAIAAPAQDKSKTSAAMPWRAFAGTSATAVKPPEPAPQPKLQVEIIPQISIQGTSKSVEELDKHLGKYEAANTKAEAAYAKAAEVAVATTAQVQPAAAATEKPVAVQTAAAKPQKLAPAKAAPAKEEAPAKPNAPQTAKPAVKLTVQPSDDPIDLLGSITQADILNVTGSLEDLCKELGLFDD